MTSIASDNSLVLNRLQTIVLSNDGLYVYLDIKSWITTDFLYPINTFKPEQNLLLKTKFQNVLSWKKTSAV